MGIILILQTFLLGVVEGLTEFIPVSSTAHLLIAGKAIGIPSEAFLKTLSISIQSGAILAAVLYFWTTVWKNKNLIPKILLAFLPTAIVGILAYPLIKGLFDNLIVIAVALILGGLGLILIKTKDEQWNVSYITYKQAFWVGVMQIASFVPGVSRAGATLIGGTLLGIQRSLIVPFSFLLAIPTIFGATVVEIKNVPPLDSQQVFLLLLGGFVAFITALMTMKFFIKLLTQKPLSWFGWYRIAIGIIVLILVI